MTPTDTETVTIRRATDDDARAITALYLNCRKQRMAYAPLAHDDAAVAYWITHILIPQQGVWLAEEAGQVVGFYALSQDQQGGWLDQLYLQPERIREGLGSRLLQHALAQADYPLRLYSFQQNQAACRFYEQQGFRAEKLRDGRDNEEGIPDILYQLGQRP